MATNGHDLIAGRQSGNNSAANWLIQGRAGIQIFGAAGTLANFGTVLGTGDIGASFSGQAVVTNGVASATSGLIQGTYGINIAGSGTVTNYGTIIAPSASAVIVRHGTFINRGMVKGSAYGIEFGLPGTGARLFDAAPRQQTVEDVPTGAGAGDPAVDGVVGRVVEL